MEQTPMVFDLSNEIEFSKGGDFERTASITIEGPTFLTMDHVQKIEHFITSAFLKVGQENKTKAEEANTNPEDSKLDAKSIMFMLTSAGIDHKALKDSFVTMCSHCATLDADQKVKMQVSHFSQMGYQDIKRFIGEYIENFIIPSVL